LPEAESSARTALELQPDYVGAAALLIAVKRFSDAHDDDLERIESLFARDDLATDDRITLAFALAKAYDNVRDYDRAFAHLEIGNRLRRASLDYDVERDLRFLRRIAAIFDRPLLERLSGNGTSSQLPILIVGMPRSGTTLVEQILASHPQVYGAGERLDLHDLATSVALLSESRLGYPEGVPDLRREHLARIGEAYVSRLKDLGGAAPHVTDKAPLNFAHLGFLRLVAPEARVIHCTRNPLDTCVSCYSIDFGFASVPCAYDLTELGRYYAGDAELMEHWQRTLPEGWVLDVNYEELVANFEHEARRLVEHCGLAWDDACLQFHQADRAVH